MIKSFKHKGFEDFFHDGKKKGVQAKHADKLEDLLDILNAASNIKDMNFPGSGLHQLKGKLKGYWAIKVSGNWRLIFKFSNTNAFDVDYIDYH